MDHENIFSEKSDANSINFSNGVTRQEIMRLFEIDNTVYDKDSIVPYSTIEKWHIRNSNLYCVARENSSNKIVGYIGVFPLIPETFKKAMSSDFDENSIQPTDIEVYDKPGIFHLYINSIVIMPMYQKKFSIYKKMFNSYIDFLVRLAEKDIYFYDVCTRAVSLAGESICHIMQMKRITEENSKVQTFYSTLLPPALLVPKHAELFNTLYNKKYQELLSNGDQIENFLKEN